MTVGVVGAAITFSVLLFILKSLGWRGASVMGAACVATLFFAVIIKYGDVISDLGALCEDYGVGESAGVMIKIIGVSYLFGICADTCRELGEAGIAKTVDVVGRVEIIAIIMPYFKEIIEIGVGLLE